MPLPLPRKVLDLIGRKTYWQETRDSEKQIATVVGVRWSGTTVQLRNGQERAGIQFMMDLGDGRIMWSATYPEPEDDADTADPGSESAPGGESGDRVPGADGATEERAP